MRKINQKAMPLGNHMLPVELSCLGIAAMFQKSLDVLGCQTEDAIADLKRQKAKGSGDFRMHLEEFQDLIEVVKFRVDELCNCIHLLQSGEKQLFADLSELVKQSRKRPTRKKHGGAS